MRVSVVIPTFNRAAFLREALASVDRQAYADFEVVVVDDGSTDETAEVVAASPLCPVYVRQENGGRGAARNAGIGRATGDLVAFLDSDDLWHPERLARHVAFFSSHPDAVFVHGPVDAVDADGRKDAAGGRRLARLYRKAARHGFGLEALLDSCLIFSSAVTVRRSLFEDVGLFDPCLVMLEDLDWYLRVARRYRIDFLGGHPVVSYRFHDGNACMSGDRVVLETYERIFSRHVDPEPDGPASEAVRAQVNLSLSFCRAGLGDGPRARRHIRQAFALRPRSVVRVDVLKRLAKLFLSKRASAAG